MQQEPDADTAAAAAPELAAPELAAQELHASPEAAPGNQLDAAAPDASVLLQSAGQEALHAAPAADNFLVTPPESAPAFAIAAPAPDRAAVGAGQATQIPYSYPIAELLILAAIVVCAVAAAAFALDRRKRRRRATALRSDLETDAGVGKSGRAPGAGDPAADEPHR